MNSRERVERAIRFEQPDRLPFNFWADRRRMDELDAKYGKDFRYAHYGADVVEWMPAMDFGMGRHETTSGTVWMVEEAFQDWTETRDMPMPDPADPAILAGLDEALEQHRERAVIVNMPNVLTYIEFMRRQENLFVDMLTVPELVAEFFGRMSDAMAGIAERVCKHDITALYVMDDIACNKGLVMSMDLFRQLVLPNWKKVIDVAHAHDKPVFFHTDGRVVDLWDTFADELGVRMLNPLQPDLQDVGEFKRRYHGRTGIYGGLETGRIHQMSPDEIREHVHRLFEQAGQGGGLIVSSHDIDYSVREETLDAMVRAIRECEY